MSQATRIAAKVGSGAFAFFLIKGIVWMVIATVAATGIGAV